MMPLHYMRSCPGLGVRPPGKSWPNDRVCADPVGSQGADELRFDWAILVEETRCAYVLQAVGFEPTRSYLQWILSPPP